MKLRPKCEHVRASILNRDDSNHLDKIFGELFAKETYLKSLSFVPVVIETALVARTQKGMPWDVTKVECFSCHEMGYFANQCRNKKGNTSGELFCLIARKKAI